MVERPHSSLPRLAEARQRVGRPRRLVRRSLGEGASAQRVGGRLPADAATGEGAFDINQLFRKSKTRRLRWLSWEKKSKKSKNIKAPPPAAGQKRNSTNELIKRGKRQMDQRLARARQERKVPHPPARPKPLRRGEGPVLPTKEIRANELLTPGTGQI